MSYIFGEKYVGLHKQVIPVILFSLKYWPIRDRGEIQEKIENSRKSFKLKYLQ
jgi:hypothetical protein